MDSQKLYIVQLSNSRLFHYSLPDTRQNNYGLKGAVLEIKFANKGQRSNLAGKGQFYAKYSSTL